LEVTPQDEIWVETSADACERIRDFSPFQMRVAGRIEDNGSLIGVFGLVVGGPPRYQRLVANLFVRLDGSDWTRDGSTQANFKVGPRRAERVPGYDFRDPRGTQICGFPVIGRFGRIEVLSGEPNAGADHEERGHGAVPSRAPRARSS
jgi:hypothetical protein